jgi:uncharacterized protein (TIGR03083 family)
MSARGYARWIEYATFVEHVRDDGQRLIGAAAGDPSTAVPSCPGWTLADLVVHVAQVYEHKIACTELGRAPDPWPPEWPPERDPVEWLADAHARLLAMFDRSDATTPSATWWPPDQTVGFWARRMAHETAVHRFDAELANGATVPVNAELATDGVDEILSLMLAGDWSEDPDDAASGQRVAISTGGRTWLVTIDRDAMTIDAAAGEAPVATIGGEPSEVLLWLWGRLPDERVERSGEEDALRLLRSRLVLATQ